MGRSAAIVAVSAFIATLLMQMFGTSNCTLHLRARAQILSLATKIESFREHAGTLPTTLDVLASGAHDGPYAKPKEFEDPWGERFYYRSDPQHGTFRLFTLGSDRRPGGTADASDIDAEDVISPTAGEPSAHYVFQTQSREGL